MEAKNSIDESTLNPWPECKEEECNSIVETGFDDNFTIAKTCKELNLNGLKLPDSEHYLAVLERKLSRIQNKPSTGKEYSNRVIAKEILKSLNLKRDAIFQRADQDTPTAEPEGLNSGDSTQGLSSLSLLITNSVLYGALEKKIAPQVHAVDAEEVKKLLDADLLNLIRDLDATDGSNDTNGSTENGL